MIYNHYQYNNYYDNKMQIVNGREMQGHEERIPGMSLSRLPLAHSTPHVMSCFCPLMVTFTQAEPLNNTQHDDILTLILTEPKL